MINYIQLVLKWITRNNGYVKVHIDFYSKHIMYLFYVEV